MWNAKYNVKIAILRAFLYIRYSLLIEKMA